MSLSRRQLASTVAATALAGDRARAQDAGPVRIGALSDLSSAYADLSGPAR